ncbi:biotin-dependent carboxyltransferase family protein [Candidatus Colwellia aromaticivorans]|uniref:5-oxoprolinase subunit C family protein n=1 Tax=Candidatus Colwellia aromaticivorans TaxID=2267621 RepID=UPI000DF23454|nr:biotin-dependent carboxyltransferase family protein [Candidatus Colwellia aromaticivorans]
MSKPSLTQGFLVEQAGVLSLIQDAGRFGAFNIGLTNGGPVDLPAFKWANRLCGNKLNSTAIEINIGGLTLTAQIDTTLAVTGANMPLTINGEKKSLWRSYHVKAGDVIALGFAAQGVRCYLAVAGGFSLAPSFGSTATVCREGIGGLHGGKLEAGDVLVCARRNIHNNLKKNLSLEDKLIPTYTDEVILHTIPSYQQKYFSSHQQRLFFSNEYTVSKSFDRMGYRLEGQAIACDIDGILSEGICHGAVQIPADGQPIVLLNDRQTIGGYPKIGAVSSIDTAKLGQLNQGGKVRFEPISMEQAHNLFHLNLSRFNRTELVVCD